MRPLLAYVIEGIKFVYTTSVPSGEKRKSFAVIFPHSVVAFQSA